MMYVFVAGKKSQRPQKGTALYQQLKTSKSYFS